MKKTEYGSGYGKMSFWQWVGIYVVIGVLVYGLFYYFYMSKQSGPMYDYSQTSTTQTPSTTMAAKKSVTLGELNKSGESGTATLEEVNGKTVVTLSLTGFPTNAQPAHIHVGSCPGVGAVKYPLTSVVSGKSVTMLDVPLSQLDKELPLAINVHQSAEDSKTYTACGQL